MHDTFLTTRGTLKVPKEILKKLEAKPGTRFVWGFRSDGSLYVGAKTKSLKDLMGLLTPPNGMTVAIEDMDPFR